jgi:hypothetical protein
MADGDKPPGEMTDAEWMLWVRDRAARRNGYESFAHECAEMDARVVEARRKGRNAEREAFGEFARGVGNTDADLDGPSLS